MTKVPLVQEKIYLIIGFLSPVIFYLYGNISVVLLLLYYALNLKNKFVLNKKDIKRTLKYFVAFLPVIFIMSFLCKIMLFEYEEQKLVVEIKKNFNNNLFFNFFLIIIVAPIIEEIVFRGLFYKTLKNFIPFVQASIISSLIFAIIHENILSLTILFLLSLYLTWIYERTNSILYSIITHSIFNFLNLLLIYIGSNG